MLGRYRVHRPLTRTRVNHASWTAVLLTVAVAMIGCGTEGTDSGRDSAEVFAAVDAADPLAPRPLESETHLTVAVTTPIATYANFFLAEKLGEFTKENLAVTFKVVPVQDAQVLLNQGEVDAALTGFTPGIMNLIAAGGSVKAVWPAGGRAPDSTQGWYANKSVLGDDGQFQGSDVKGKTLAGPAVPGTGALSFFFEKVRETDPDVAVSDLAYQSLQVPDAVQALVNGSVDIAYASAPFNSRLASDPNYVFLDGTITSEPTVFAWFGKKLGQTHTDIGLAFTRAVARTTHEYLLTDYRGDDAVVTALADSLNQPKETILALEPSAFNAHYTLPEPFVPVYEAFYREQDSITYDDALAPDDVFDLRFTKALNGSEG